MQYSLRVVYANTGSGALKVKSAYVYRLINKGHTRYRNMEAK